MDHSLKWTMPQIISLRDADCWASLSTMNRQHSLNSLAFVPWISILRPPSPPLQSCPAHCCHHCHCGCSKVTTSVRCRGATATSISRGDFLRILLFTTTATATSATASLSAAAAAAAAAAATTTSVSSHHPSDAPPPPPPSLPVQPSDLDVARAADLLHAHCLPFLQAISPLSLDALLYRGHPLPLPLSLHSTSVRRNDSMAPKSLRLTLDTSPGDLFDPDTYGVDDRAAVPFFHTLDTYLETLAAQSLSSDGIGDNRRPCRHCYWDGNAIDAEDSTYNPSQSGSCNFNVVPRVRGAHIGTGSPDDAAQWGVPLTVWPIGSNVRFAVWDTTTPTATSTSTSTHAAQLRSKNNDGLIVDDENVMIRHDPQRFIYARGDTFLGAIAAKGPLAFDANSVRAAVVRGHEVLFQCAAFYVMPQQLVAPVLRTLGVHGVPVHADDDR